MLNTSYVYLAVFDHSESPRNSSKATKHVASGRNDLYDSIQTNYPQRTSSGPANKPIKMRAGMTTLTDPLVLAALLCPLAPALVVAEGVLVYTCVPFG